MGFRISALVRCTIAAPMMAGLCACSSAPTNTAQSDADGGGASGEPVVQEFRRLGYRIAVPADWTATEGYLVWEGRGGPPHRGTPAFDTLKDPSDGDPFIVVGKRSPVRTGDVDRWIDEMVRLRAITYDPGECNPVEHASESTLGDEPARVRAFHCPVDGPDAVAVQVIALHRRSGWVVTCYDHHIDSIEKLSRDCDDWLSSFAFLD